MKSSLVRFYIRRKLSWQSVQGAVDEIKKWEERYLELAHKLSSHQLDVVIPVPEMMGVDKEMTQWSYNQLLAHNTIVNRAMTANVKRLMTGEQDEEFEGFDPKHDVLPGAELSSDQDQLFARSIADHLEVVKRFGHLKSARTSEHPVFGVFDAHMWHGMFGGHLGVHYKQAEMIAYRAMGQ